jgi:TPR repeat protein
MSAKYDYEIAFEAFDRKDYEAVLQYALPYASKGDPDAQCIVSLLYQSGFGVKRDFGEAERWLLKAAEQDSGVAWNNLGSLYASRFPGLSRGPEGARECYQRAKELGFNCAAPYPPSGSDRQ